MSTPITLTGAYTCTHHNDQQRAACPVCLIATLTTERDAARARAERAEAELAAERARLDWLMAGGMCLVQHSGGFHVCRLNCQVSRAAIDLGMKEDAK